VHDLTVQDPPIEDVIEIVFAQETAEMVFAQEAVE
jgi:hypothetical protein